VYQAAIDKLNSGQIAKADHGGFKDSIDEMKCELDATRKLRRATSGQRGNARTLARLPATSSTTVIPETDGAPKTVTEPREIPGGS